MSSTDQKVERGTGSFRLPIPEGAELWWASLGAGDPPVVLADGLGCDGFIWKYLAPALAKQHRVIRFNYRGHGRSTLPTDPSAIGIEASADDIARVLDAAGIDRAVVAGHSMGVQVLLEFHRRHPDRVLGLVPVCGAYGNALDTFHDDAVAGRFFPLAEMFTEKFPELTRKVWSSVLPTPLSVFIARNLESKPWLLKRDDMWPYLTHMAQLHPLTFVRTLSAASRHSAWDHLGHIEVPTLVVAGEKDLFTPMWLSERIHHAIHGSELLVLPQASHTAPLEMPELLELKFQSWLDANFRSAKKAA